MEYEVLDVGQVEGGHFDGWLHVVAAIYLDGTQKPSVIEDFYFQPMPTTERRFVRDAERPSYRKTVSGRWLGKHAMVDGEWVAVNYPPDGPEGDPWQTEVVEPDYVPLIEKAIEQFVGTATKQGLRGDRREKVKHSPAARGVAAMPNVRAMKGRRKSWSHLPAQ